ncbi:MAG: pseudouridine synthase [Proteobacteria bacterium]|nr:pseudouridine synthase [Pseudomonadota bacterium]
MSAVLQRLSKFLSNSGIDSRRKSEEIIRAGRVFVNNINVLEPQYRVDPNTDTIKLDNKAITNNNSKTYIALYKPVGYISDLKDVRGRKLARDLIDLDGKLFPIGRLDYNSEGLIIFTNDGELANKIMHPRYGVEKEYLVKLKGMLSDDDIWSIKKGIMIEDAPARAISITHVSTAFNNHWYSITLHEGRNRILRKMGEAIGHRILKIKRVRVGHIKLGSLSAGSYRFLKEKEIMSFKIPLD